MLKSSKNFVHSFIVELTLQRPRLLIGALKLHLFVIAATISPSVISNDSSAKPVVIMGGSNNVSRICLYENDAYSLGSVIQIGDVYLDCVPEKKIETDGRLMWRKIEVESNVHTK